MAPRKRRLRPAVALAISVLAHGCLLLVLRPFDPPDPPAHEPRTNTGIQLIELGAGDERPQSTGQAARPPQDGDPVPAEETHARQKVRTQSSSARDDAPALPFARGGGATVIELDAPTAPPDASEPEPPSGAARGGADELIGGSPAPDLRARYGAQLAELIRDRTHATALWVTQQQRDSHVKLLIRVLPNGDIVPIGEGAGVRKWAHVLASGVDSSMERELIRIVRAASRRFPAFPEGLEQTHFDLEVTFSLACNGVDVL